VGARGLKKIPKRILTMQKIKYFKHFQNEEKTFYGPAIIRGGKTLFSFFALDQHKLPIIRINEYYIYIVTKWKIIHRQLCVGILIIKKKIIVIIIYRRFLVGRKK